MTAIEIKWVGCVKLATARAIPFRFGSQPHAPSSPSHPHNHASVVWSRRQETTKHQSRRSLYFFHPHLHLGRSEIAAGGAPQPTQAAAKCSPHPGLVEGPKRGPRSSGPVATHAGPGPDGDQWVALGGAHRSRRGVLSNLVPRCPAVRRKRVGFIAIRICN